MMDTKRAFCMQSRAVSNAMRQGIIKIRRDHSLPAFGNCSLDDNIGEGDLRSGKAFGQINGYLIWRSETIVDQPGLYEITVWLYPGDSRGRGAAPLDSCTVDLTPRRCQKFKAKPDQRFRWSSVRVKDGKEIENGRTRADSHGLVTLRRITVTKNKRRFSIVPE
jgi:hypothetical protein